MKTTGNLGLKKPEGTDNVDIADLNGNMDILDTAVKAVQDHAADTVKHIAATERSTWNAKETTAGAQAKADAVQTNLTTHAGNTTAHITAAERTTWNAKAPIDSPAFTGIPTAPTASIGTKTTQIATTALVEALRVYLIQGIEQKAAKSSPVLTGTPEAPTAAAGTNDDQIATTAFANRAAQGIPQFATTAGTATAYTATFPASISLTAGLRLTFKAHAASGANPTINANGLGAKAVRKPNGSAASLASNGVYTVVYDGTAFILQGEGGVDITGSSAEPHNVLKGATFWSGMSDKEQVGTMYVGAGESLPAVIAAESSQGDLVVHPYDMYLFTAIDETTKFVVSDGSFAPENILAGKTVLSKAGTATSDATATAADIAANKSAYINGNKVWGTFTTADATATAADIKIGKTAYVNGAKVTGTNELQAIGSYLSTGVVAPNMVSSPEIAFTLTFNIPPGRNLLGFVLYPTESSTYFIKSNLSGGYRLGLSTSYMSGYGSVSSYFGDVSNKVTCSSSVISFNRSTGELVVFVYYSAYGSAALSLNNAAGLQFSLKFNVSDTY